MLSVWQDRLGQIRMDLGENQILLSGRSIPGRAVIEWKQERGGVLLEQNEAPVSYTARPDETPIRYSGTAIHSAQTPIRYDGAAAILPGRLRKAALSLPREKREIAEEIRLRAGSPMTVLLPYGEEAFDEMVEAEDLETLCDIASEFSRYAAAETLRAGFLPVRGGYRVGLCGTAVIKDGVNTNLINLSSAAIRIGREQKGIAKEIAGKLFHNGDFASTLILSPPGGGKTTLLRDLIRELSTGAAGYAPKRVALIDERGEVAVMVRGVPQMDVGPHTDILEACPKALAIPIVLRAMNPQIIALDEITVREDLRAVCMASGCGARILATVHASDIAELSEKPLYRELLEARVFHFAIRIVSGETGRRYEVEVLNCDQGESP